MNVMIVDDQRSSLVLLGKLVELSGGTPFAFLDPAEALRQAQSLVFDLALVDYRMPAMDGLSFIKMLRALPDTCDIPVLMVTVEDTEEVSKAAVAAGASGLVGKPVDPSELMDRCRSFARQNRDELRGQSHDSGQLRVHVVGL